MTARAGADGEPAEGELAPVVDLRAGRPRPADAPDVGGDEVDDLLRAMRRSTIGATSPADDDRVVARVTAELPSPPLALRLALGILGALQTFAVAPWLVGEDPFRLLGATSEGHLTRDGALGLAVGTAATLTAWRPRWALPSFVLASVAVVAQAVAGAVDDTITTGGNEIVHVPSVVLTCMIALCSIRLSALAPNRRR